MGVWPASIRPAAFSQTITARTRFRAREFIRVKHMAALRSIRMLVALSATMGSEVDIVLPTWPTAPDVGHVKQL